MMALLCNSIKSSVSRSSTHGGRAGEASGCWAARRSFEPNPRYVIARTFFHRNRSTGLHLFGGFTMKENVILSRAMLIANVRGTVLAR